MKIKALLIIFTLSIITVSGCISDENNFKTKHFENENISFDYPESWNVTVTQNPADIPDANWMVVIGDNELINGQNENDIRIFEFEHNSIVNSALVDNSTGKQIDSIKIDNITAPGISEEGYRMYIFDKNNKTYKIVVYAVERNAFEEYKSQFDTILNSIQIK